MLYLIQAALISSLLILHVAPSNSLLAPSATLTAETLSIPLINERPEPKTFLASLNQLWNDPRPVTSLVSDAINGVSDDNKDNKIPYCILSDEFQVFSHKFRILLYPRGRFVGSTSEGIAGPAAAYLRYERR